ncbi:hypothetical protein PGN_1247 [Porphyromonas gingivalis ATCC 33277]|uniref:Uncharacterized protein n=1 Tax=Porphyromonas gingivalis (strain ATCC 33277 / DSM 20709 / CIP 103683 / JCM 12257 / NCTC 11834 / 2561) TaxID=431947 RepID=B2RK71_PORG3|nr:hypothetical protein PGN_1247 [Porphyromonas gingivalis ATCC 33277]
MIARLETSAFAISTYLAASTTTQLSCFTPDNDPICHKDFGQRGLLCYDE